MSLLYNKSIELIPKPPRSILSIGNESTRAALPNFNTVAELSRFTSRHFSWHIPIPSLYIQSIATGAFVFLMVVIVTLIMARRIYEGKFWLLRVIRRSTGIIIAPNPIVFFLIMSGFYGILFTPLFIIICHDFTKDTGPPRNIVLWFTVSSICFLIVTGAYNRFPLSFRGFRSHSVYSMQLLVHTMAHPPPF